MTTPIWINKFTLEQLNKLSEKTLQEYLGIEFIEIGDDYLKARMAVDWKVHQPHGILHGGASVALAESTGSMAAQMCAENGRRCIGLDINANHIRRVKSGMIYSAAKPVHLGQNTQVWVINITNEEGLTVCHSRLTMMVLSPNLQKST